MKNPQCPACSTELIRGKRMRYETLCEHVCDPNGYNPRPTRDTWLCPNPHCVFCQRGFWSDAEGAWYNYYYSDDVNIFMNVPDIFPYFTQTKGIFGWLKRLMCSCGFHDYSKDAKNEWVPTTKTLHVIINEECIPVAVWKRCRECGYLHMRWSNSVGLFLYKPVH